ncbi:MAG: hypothetical protein HPY69_07725 [Armatimonadetes bacterium]|nr:hypothetical protein [Armatimonadota bacterium]
MSPTFRRQDPREVSHWSRGACPLNDAGTRVHDTVGMAGIWKPVTLVWGDTSYSPMMMEEVVRLKRAAD